MSTGNFENWDGNMMDLGPLYPFVGSEGLMVVVLIVLWVAWHVAQMIGEKRELENRERQFKDSAQLQKAVESERVIERM
jgi:hypothetical protein